MDYDTEEDDLNKTEPHINRGFELMLRYISRRRENLKSKENEIKTKELLKLEPECKQKKWWKIW